MIEQLQEVIPNAPRVRVLGARYSFNDIAAKEGRVETAFELDHNAQSVLRTNRRRNVIWYGDIEPEMPRRVNIVAHRNRMVGRWEIR